MITPDPCQYCDSETVFVEELEEYFCPECNPELFDNYPCPDCGQYRSLEPDTQCDFCNEEIDWSDIEIQLRHADTVADIDFGESKDID